MNGKSTNINLILFVTLALKKLNDICLLNFVWDLTWDIRSYILSTQVFLNKRL